MAHTVVKFRKISAGKHNVRYLEDREEHPGICLTYSTCSENLWDEYFKVNREAFEKSGQKGNCVEAREFILVFPEEFYKLPAESRENFLKAVVNKLRDKYGIEIYAAMHGSDDDHKNLHIHCMYMERTPIVEQDKIAQRNMYFNPEGKQVRAKKDAVDPETKELLPGYTMVLKGECYGKKKWTAKKKWLHSQDFTKAIKEDLTYIINVNLNKTWAKGMEEREVYDREKSPYLPLQDVLQPLTYRDPDKPDKTLKIETEASKDIVECNALRIEYNDLVREALQNGVLEEDLIRRRKGISKEIATACEQKESFRIKEILDRAVQKLFDFVKSIVEAVKGSEVAKEEELPKFNPADFMNQYKNKSISFDDVISGLKKGLDQNGRPAAPIRNHDDRDL